MKIYSWNVNGIRAVEKKGFIDWFLEEKPDILCLQETKIQLNQISEELKNIDGYYAYFSCAKRKGYSGVAIYTKQKPLTVKQEMGITRFDDEGRILVSEYPEFTLLNIYFPNGQKDEERLNYKLEFNEAVLDYCHKLKKEDKKIIICGDFNIAHREIDLKKPQENANRSGFLPIERQWIDRLIENGYVDTFREIHPKEVKYSWWSYRFKSREKGIGWRIDYHFVSENLVEKVVDADILDCVTSSDHCPVTLYLKI